MHEPSKEDLRNNILVGLFTCVKLDPKAVGNTGERLTEVNVVGLGRLKIGDQLYNQLLRVLADVFATLDVVLENVGRGQPFPYLGLYSEFFARTKLKYLVVAKHVCLLLLR